MGNLIVEILEKHGPMLSGNLGKVIGQITNLSEPAVRQRLSRISSPVKRLSGIRFTKNQRFLYLDSQFAKTEFKEKLIQSFYEASSSYANAIRALINKGGRLPRSSWFSSCGSPVVKLKGHLLSQTILEQLTACNIAEVSNDQRFGQTIQLSVGSIPKQKMWALSIAETTVLNMVSQWARNLGLTSYSQQNIRSFDKSPPEFGGFAWDYTAPCFLSGVARFDRKTWKPIPGFFVGDICLDRPISYDDLSPFFAKLKALRNRTGVRGFLPCYIATQLELHALKALRQNNVLVGLVDNIFDKETKDLIGALIHTLERATQIASSNPEQIELLLAGLSKLEGETLNVRGALFTLIVGNFFSSRGARIEINKEIYHPESGQRGDIDVLADESNAIVTCVECKGKSSNALITKTEAERWLVDRIPLMRRYLLAHESHRHKKLVFELWTSGEVAKDAAEYLQARREAIGKYEVNYRDRSAVLDLLQKAKLSNLTKMLKEHYSTPHVHRHNTHTVREEIH